MLCDAREVTLRTANIGRMRNGLFDVLVVGGGINGAVSAASLAGRGASVALIDRGDFGGFTSQESSNLVWGGFKYLENYELPARVRAVPLAQPADEGLPRQHQGDRLPRRRSTAASPYRPWFAGLGATAYWVIGLFGTRPPAPVRRRARSKARGAGRSTRRPRVGGIAVPGRLPRRQRLALRVLVRALGDRGRRRRRQLRRAGLAPSGVGDRWVAELRDVDTGEEFTTSARVDRQRRRPVRRRAQRARGACTTEHRIVYSKGIHLVVPRLTTTRHDRVLAFFDDTRAAVLRDPDGPPLGDRHHRHPRRHPVHRTSTDDDREFLLDQINARLDLAAAAHRRRHHRRAVRRAAARGRASGAATTPDADWTSLSRKHEIERDDRPRVVTVFGGKLTDCLNVGEEVAARDRGSSASRSRRTCTTGTASRPRRPATSSTARPG